MTDLSGRTVLVTGGASGIGAACAAAFAKAGASVIVADLDADGAARVAGGIGANATAVGVDLADPAFDAAAIAGGADVVVNNAGIQHVSPVEEFPEEKFRLIIALMLEAPFRLARAALPHMYAGGWGRIVNISSVHGLRASAYKSAYVAAKHGLEGLSKTIALEGGGKGVTSNTICPAYVRTPLVEKQIADQARIHGIGADEVIEKIMLTEPAVKRLVEPAEVADLAVWLCSPGMSFANGSSYVLDGGWTARLPNCLVTEGGQRAIDRQSKAVNVTSAPQEGSQRHVECAGKGVNVTSSSAGRGPHRPHKLGAYPYGHRNRYRYRSYLTDWRRLTLNSHVQLHGNGNGGFSR